MYWCSILPTAAENAVAESAVTTVYSSMFQSATVLTKNEFLYCLVLLSQILKPQEFRILCLAMVLSGSQSLKVVGRCVFFFYFCLLESGSSLEAWLGGGPSQSCRGLSAAAASFVPAVVAVLAPGASVSCILSLPSCSPSWWSRLLGIVPSLDSLHPASSMDPILLRCIPVRTWSEQCILSADSDNPGSEEAMCRFHSLTIYIHTHMFKHYGSDYLVHFYDFSDYAE